MMRRTLAVASIIAVAACGSKPPPTPEPPPIVVPVASVPPVASNTQPVIPQDLPRAADFVEQQVVFAVDLTASGELRANGKPVAEEQLMARAREAKSAEPELRAVIRADAAVSWGRVVRVMDLLKQAGISRLAFGVTPMGK